MGLPQVNLWINCGELWAFMDRKIDMVAATRVKKEDAQKEIDPFDDITETFRNALGDLGQGSVKIFVKRGRDTKHSYLGQEPIGDGDIDGFVEQVRKDYPDGGDFLFKLCDEGGKIKATKQLSLAALPSHEREKLGLNIRPRDDNSELLIAMMNSQSQNAQNSQNMMTTMMTTLMTVMMNAQSQSQQSMSTMLAAIIPAMAGNKGESASAVIASSLGAIKALMPPQEDNGAEKVFGYLRMAKELLPGGDGGGGGSDDDSFGSLFKNAAPLLGSMLSAAQNQTPAPQPQQTTTAVPTGLAPDIAEHIKRRKAK